jgi:serine/threonine protein kinase
MRSSGGSFPDPGLETRPSGGAPAAGTSAGGGDSGPLATSQDFGSRYHILRLLGVGGMGAVYQAWDAELGMAVALKVVRPEATANAEVAREMERRFKQELVLARKVTHKNVVRIHDLGTIDGIKYITMPYLEGADLASVLESSGTLAVPAALRLVRDVAWGLVAAHEAGIGHRDLKPANIMVVDDHAVIITFAGFRSRCTTPALCAATSPASIVRITRIARNGGSTPSRLRMVARSSPSMNGIVMYLMPSTSPMSWIRTTFL